MSAKKKTGPPLDSTRNDIQRYLEAVESWDAVLSPEFDPTDEVWGKFAEALDHSATKLTRAYARAWLFEHGHILAKPRKKGPDTLVDDRGQGLPVKVKHPHSFEDAIASEIEKAEYTWLWQGRLAGRALNMIAGQMGHGKTSLLSEIAARITRGTHWPDHKPEDAPIENGEVLIVQAEESLGSVQVPRLERHGADMERIRFLRWVNFAGVKLPFNFARDHAVFEAYLEKNDGIRLVMFDPIGAFLAGTDGNGEIAARMILDPYIRICEEREVCMLLVSHLNKDEEKDIINRLSGTGAIGAICRMVWYLSPNPFDRSRRLLSFVKGNGEADVPKAIGFGLSDRRIIEWDADGIDLDAQQVNDMLLEQRRLERTKGSDKVKSIKDNIARAFILKALEAGPMTQPDLFKEARKRGIAESSYRVALKFLSGPDDGRIEKTRPEGSKRFVLSLTAETPANIVEITVAAANAPSEPTPPDGIDRWHDDGGSPL